MVTEFHSSSNYLTWSLQFSWGLAKFVMISIRNRTPRVAAEQRRQVVAVMCDGGGDAALISEFPSLQGILLCLWAHPLGG